MAVVPRLALLGALLAIGGLAAPAGAQDAPKPDAPAQDAPKPQVPVDDAPKPDAPDDDAPKPDAPGTGGSQTPAPTPGDSGTDVELQEALDSIDEAEQRYEPDQRGDRDEGPRYEPDQRGDEDADGQRTSPPPMGSPPGYDYGQGAVFDELSAGAPDEIDGDCGAPTEGSLERRAAGSDKPRAAGFYLRIENGYSLLHPTALSGDNLVMDALAQPHHGYLVGLAVGIDFPVLDLGMRFDRAMYGEGLSRTGMLFELRYRMGNPSLQPSVRAGVGAVLLSGFAPGPSTEPSGTALELGFGLEGRATDAITIGGGIDAGLLLLSRDGWGNTCPLQAGCTVGGADATHSGSATGFELRLHLDVGLRL